MATAAVTGLARRPWRLTGGGVVAGVALTIWVFAQPGLHFAWRSPATHLVLETADAVIAAIVALLVYGRFRRSQEAADLLLSSAMTLLAVAGLGFVTIPELAGVSATQTLTSWAPLVLRLAAAGLVAAGALLPASAGAPRRLVYGPALCGFVVAVLVVALAAPHALPSAIEPASPLAGGPPVAAHPALFAAEIADLLFYGVSCVAYTRRAKRAGDEFISWIGAAAGLSAVARIDYMLVPSLFSDYVYVGDLLRTAFYLFLLIGAAREIERYGSAIAAAAAVEERQRIARDLHDGLAQELTYIWSQLQELGRDPQRGDAALARLTSASARAIDEARRAIAALGRQSDEPLVDTLARSAEEVAHRYGVAVELDLDAGVAVSPDVREAMIRIMREAISNAARHSGADRIAVRLVNHDGVRLEVCDRGSGFDLASAARSTGFGLTSMRQRAEASGGQFAARSSVGRGTSVSVVWP